MPPQSLTFHFEIAGDVQIRRRFAGALANTEDLSPALERIADHFLEHMRDVFATEGMATAGHWPALSKSYAAWKKKHYGKLPMLVLEGDLRKAMTTKGDPGNIREVTKDSLTVGGSRPTENGRWDVGMLHQTGTDRMPRRRIIHLPDHVKVRWVGFLREHLAAGEKGTVRSRKL